jgi:predicted DNA-binding transcriptional regulator AlpA
MSRAPICDPYPPRGLSREEAARWVGISASLFDQMVKDGRMPGPKLINSRVVWDRFRVDQAFHDLPEKAPKDDAAGDDWSTAA